MKRLCLFLALALAIAGTSFAGGTEEATTESGAPMVIEVFQWGPRDVAADDRVVAFINEQLNIDLRISRILAREYTKNLEVKIAAGDVPDLFRLRTNDPHVYQNLHRDDYLANVSDYANELSLKALLAWFEEPGVGDFAEADGFYRVPSKLRPQGATGNLLYRKDWMDKLGLKTPETNEDLRQLLQAIAEAKPGGEDTIPLTGTGAGQLNGLTIGYTGANGWKLVGGRYLWVHVVPGYKEGLRYLKSLYEQGLIDREYFTLNETKSRGKFVGGTAFIALPNGNTFDRHPQYSRLLAENEPDAVVGILRNPAGPEGVVYGGAYGLTSPWVVPKHDKTEAKIEQVVTLLDYVHTKEGQDSVLDGIEGIHFTMENGKRVTNDAYERDIIPGLGHMFAMSTDYSRNKINVNETLERAREYATERAVYNPLPDSYSGPVFLAKMKQITEVWETWFTDFVTGIKDLDADWDDYQSALDRVGLDEVTKEVNDHLR